MTVDLLSARLKAAKRELTALKTAHERGLGNLRVYEFQDTIPSAGHQDEAWTLMISIDFDEKFSPYPFIYLIPTIQNTGLRFNVDAEGFQYTNGGKSAEYKIYYSYEEAALDLYTIISTAPIINVQYRWSAA